MYGKVAFGLAVLNAACACVAIGSNWWKITGTIDSALYNLWDINSEHPFFLRSAAVFSAVQSFVILSFSAATITAFTSYISAFKPSKLSWIWSVIGNAATFVFGLIAFAVWTSYAKATIKVDVGTFDFLIVDTRRSGYGFQIVVWCLAFITMFVAFMAYKKEYEQANSNTSKDQNCNEECEQTNSNTNKDQANSAAPHTAGEVV